MADSVEPARTVGRSWPTLDAPKAACLYPWCTRRLTYRSQGSGRQPLFCTPAHRDLYGKERRLLTRRLQAARRDGNSSVASQLGWKLLRFPDLQGPSSTESGSAER